MIFRLSIGLTVILALVGCNKQEQLWQALTNEDFAQVEVLAKEGANLLERNEYALTPLDILAEQYESQAQWPPVMQEALLKSQETAQALYRKRREQGFNEQTLRSFIANNDFSFFMPVSEQAQNSLWQNVALGASPSVLQAFVDAGIDIDHPVRDNMSALYVLLFEPEDHPFEIKQLGEFGASWDYAPTTGVYAGKTHLLMAVEQRDIDRVNYLLNQGANAGHIFPNGDSLFGAITAEAGYLNFYIYQDILEVLLQAGLPTDHVNSRGNTAMHDAVLNDNTRLLSHLLELGVPYDVANVDGKTPIELAEENLNVYALNLFVDAGAQLSRSGLQHEAQMANAVQRRDYSFVAELILQGVALPKGDPDTILELIVACEVDAMTYLVNNNGLELDGLYERHGSMLQLVVEQLADKRPCWREMAELAVAYGEDIDITTRSSDQYTPLWIAALRENFDMVHWLLVNGADPTVDVGYGDTLYEFAEYRQDERLLRLLGEKE